MHCNLGYLQQCTHWTSQQYLQANKKKKKKRVIIFNGSHFNGFINRSHCPNVTCINQH